MKNLLYLFYFLKTSDWKKLKEYQMFVTEKFGISKCKQVLDVVNCSLKYGTSFHEYYYYGFYNKSSRLRKEYASMGFMYEFQKKNNPIDKRQMLSDKNLFDKAFAEFMKRDIMNPITGTVKEIEEFIDGKEKIVIKRSTGGQGKNVKIIDIRNYSPAQIKQEALLLQFDIMEEFVIQHEDLQRLSPNSLNTVRFITQQTKDNTIDIVGASLRMGLEKNTDNLSAGGIAAKINIETGVIESNGISFDITLPVFVEHPVSHVKLIGFQIPYWEEVKEMCIKAASKYSDNKSIGWDVAIKSDGPLLIEGNHDWGARVWQMPAGKGMKHSLSRYL